jgi:hypothetical protein
VVLNEMHAHATFLRALVRATTAGKRSRIDAGYASSGWRLSDLIPALTMPLEAHSNRPLAWYFI